ncbi:MAG: ABC transporter ATP-binding protein [Maricaulaceae bacterium]|jgi:osmoprotectant transport system ATP-binding protein
MLSFRNVSKAYRGALAVAGVSLEIARGRFLAVIGESGSGKSTLLKMINRLIEPTFGAIELDGEDLASRDVVALRRSIGYVFQGVGLFPHMTAGENVAITPRLLGWPEVRVAERVESLLDRVGLSAETYAERYPHELSGGQRQRVGFARALASETCLLLLDEPFGALDPVIRADLQDDLRQLHDSLGLTTVMVTHDMSEALLLADEIAVMRAGKIVQTGAPRELVRAPADDYVAHLISAPRRHAAVLTALDRPADDAT